MRGRDFNADYTDQLGRTPLHLAVVNDHKEVGIPLPSELLNPDDLVMHMHRAGFRHVRGVRPNRAAKFRGRNFGLLKLTGQFEQL